MESKCSRLRFIVIKWTKRVRPTCTCHLWCTWDRCFFSPFSSLSSSFPPPLVVSSLSLFYCLLSLSLSSFSLSLSLSEWCCVVVVFGVCVSVCIGKGRDCVYVQTASVCTGTTRTCVSSCARGAGTHGDVLNRHTGFFSVPHHTHHDHNHSHSHNRHHMHSHTQHHTQHNTQRHTETQHTTYKRVMITLAVYPALVLNHIDIQSTARESHCVNTHVKPSWKKINTKTQKIVTHVSVHTLTFHETHYFFPGTHGQLSN